MWQFTKGDCLTLLKDLSGASIDLILWNPPFGTTQQPWDEKLDWPAIFAECFRVLKPTGSLVIHCSVPFNYTLIRAAPRPPSYSWYWNKVNPTTPLLAKKQPMRQVEEVLVWGGKTYYPQRVGDEPRSYIPSGKTAYVGAVSENNKRVFVKGKYQTHYLEAKSCVDGFSTRPPAMVEMFIKAYTKEGDTILDPTCYKGLSGKVAISLGRKLIGFDKYFEAEAPGAAE